MSRLQYDPTDDVYYGEHTLVVGSAFRSTRAACLAGGVSAAEAQAALLDESIWQDGWRRSRRPAAGIERTPAPMDQPAAMQAV